jgi:hypothetical protein
VVLEFPARHQVAAAAAVVVAVAAATLAAVDDEDAVATGAMRGLDHEAVAAGQGRVQVGDLVFLAHHRVQIRYRQAGGDRELLGQQLVVDALIELARVVAQHVIGVALADAHQADAAQLAGDGQRVPQRTIAQLRVHERVALSVVAGSGAMGSGSRAKARNRYSSVRR